MTTHHWLISAALQMGTLPHGYWGAPEFQNLIGLSTGPAVFFVQSLQLCSAHRMTDSITVCNNSQICCAANMEITKQNENHCQVTQVEQCIGHKIIIIIIIKDIYIAQNGCYGCFPKYLFIYQFLL